MSHPFIAAMQAAIFEVEERFMALQGLPSSKLVRQIRETLQALAPSMREALASEPAVLPKHKRRGIWTLENGEILEFPDAHTVRTTYLRSNYNANDVAFLRRIIEAPDPINALNAYRSSHGRVLRAKRAPVEAEPDVIDSTWRERPERQMTEEDLIRAQFSGRALARELKRLERR
jgi:hypothetical protein